jgi:transcriptional regulator of NAD metabolism
MRVNLSVSTKQQIGQLIARIRTGKTVELMHITGGYHDHTVRAELRQERKDPDGISEETRRDPVSWVQFMSKITTSF